GSSQLEHKGVASMARSTAIYCDQLPAMQFCHGIASIGADQAEHLFWVRHAAMHGDGQPAAVGLERKVGIPWQR
ncbi:MAG: hypothetical protein V3V97_14715, partial [Hyphomicrobiaceae bacterium]